MKKTKVVATIGPASEKVSTLKKMMRSGMNVARLNFSHGTYRHHKVLISNIRQAASATKQQVAIMQDLQGPRIRLGMLPQDGIHLKKGQHVVLVAEAEQLDVSTHIANRQVLPLGYAGLHNYLKPGHHILISDGLIDINVTSVHGKGKLAGAIEGTVKKPGILFSHKGINLPGADITAPVITTKDKQDLAFGLKQGVDFVALSFVRSADDIKALRRLVTKIGGTRRGGGYERVQVIAKIERQEALDNFDEILAAADGIMVARGDLGIEIPAAEVPLAQKEIIHKCMLAGKPAIVATQMLESMITNPKPTRAEVSDVANAVVDHADGVMLSGESAFGQYPVEAVQIMSDIAVQTEQSGYDDVPQHALEIQHPTVEDDITTVVRDLAEHEHVKAIVVNSTDGKAARMIARHRPETQIIMVTHDVHTLRRAALTWGVQAVLAPKCKTVDALITASIRAIRKNRSINGSVHGLRKGDKVIFVTHHPVTDSAPNLVKLHTV